MDIYASDEEKAEEIKAWWRKNGRSVFMGVLLGVATLAGGKYWLNYQEVRAQQAAVLYQQVLVALNDDEIDKATPVAQQLLQEFKSSAYALFAALQLADFEIKHERVDVARDYLNWAMSNAADGSHQTLAKLRLAKLAFDEGNLDQALEIVESNEDKAFSSLFAELEGDIKLSKGALSDAKLAYQTALSGLSQSDGRYFLLEMKIDNVSVSTDG